MERHALRGRRRGMKRYRKGQLPDLYHTFPDRSRRQPELSPLVLPAQQPATTEQFSRVVVPARPRKAPTLTSDLRSSFGQRGFSRAASRASRRIAIQPPRHRRSTPSRIISSMATRPPSRLSARLAVSSCRADRTRERIHRPPRRSSTRTRGDCPSACVPLAGQRCDPRTVSFLSRSSPDRLRFRASLSPPEFGAAELSPRAPAAARSSLGIVANPSALVGGRGTGSQGTGRRGF